MLCPVKVWILCVFICESNGNIFHTQMAHKIYHSFIPLGKETPKNIFQLIKIQHRKMGNMP